MTHRPTRKTKAIVLEFTLCRRLICFLILTLMRRGRTHLSTRFQISFSKLVTKLKYGDSKGKHKHRSKYVKIMQINLDTLISKSGRQNWLLRHAPTDIARITQQLEGKVAEFFAPNHKITRTITTILPFPLPVFFFFVLCNNHFQFCKKNPLRQAQKT